MSLLWFEFQKTKLIWLLLPILLIGQYYSVVSFDDNRFVLDKLVSFYDPHFHDYLFIYLKLSLKFGVVYIPSIVCITSYYIIYLVESAQNTWYILTLSPQSLKIHLYKLSVIYVLLGMYLILLRLMELTIIPQSLYTRSFSFLNETMWSIKIWICSLCVLLIIYTLAWIMKNHFFGYFF